MRAYKKHYSVDQIIGQKRPLLIWIDEFTEAQEPLLVGKTLDILTALGYHPVIICSPSGRAALSAGFPLKQRL